MIDEQFIKSLKLLGEEKGIEESLLINVIKEALLAAYRKKFGQSTFAKVEVDLEKYDFKIYSELQVASENEESDGVTTISLEDAKLKNPQVNPGDLVYEELDFNDFGRVAVQTAKQVLMQKLRDAEREYLYDYYKIRVGQLVTGRIQYYYGNSLIVNIGKTDAIMPANEQMRKETYRLGDTIKVTITDVTRTTKAPRVVVSRVRPELLAELFKVEVPEIQDGIIEIKGVSREAGYRSKIAVVSNDKNIDAIGACVGLKGNRVQEVVRELKGEKIDIIIWSEDIKEYITNAISPTKIINFHIDEPNREAKVIVNEDQVSIAIGKEGQNVRLAAKLINWKIDIMTEEEFEEYKIGQARARLKKMVVDKDGVAQLSDDTNTIDFRKDLNNISFLKTKQKEKLIENNILTLDDFLNTSAKKTKELLDISEKEFNKLVDKFLRLEQRLIDEYEIDENMAEDSDVETETNTETDSDEVENTDESDQNENVDESDETENIAEFDEVENIDESDLVGDTVEPSEPEKDEKVNPEEEDSDKDDDSKTPNKGTE